MTFGVSRSLLNHRLPPLVWSTYNNQKLLAFWKCLSQVVTFLEIPALYPNCGRMGTYSLMPNPVTLSQQIYAQRKESLYEEVLLFPHESHSTGDPFTGPQWGKWGGAALFHQVSSTVLLPRWPSSQSAGKTPSTLDLYSLLLSRTPGFPKIPPFFVLISFGSTAHSLGDGDLRFDILRQEDGGKEREGVFLPQALSNSALSILFCVPLCMPDPGDKEGKGIHLRIRPP